MIPTMELGDFGVAGLSMSWLHVRAAQIDEIIRLIPGGRTPW